MPRKSEQFTESLIKSLLPEDKEYVKADNGLRIRVYPNGTKTWSFFKTAPNGVRKTVPIGDYPSISLKQAREVANRILGDMLKEGHDIATTKTGVTFGEYMLSENYTRWSRATRNAHKEIMANLTNVIPTWMHRKQLRLFENTDFEKFVEDRLLGKGYKKPVKSSTINRNLNNIRSVFRHAFDNKEIKENPMDRFSNLKETDAVEKLSLTDDERKRLVAISRDRTLPQASTRRHMEVFVELGLYTGMRSAELHSLQWKHIKNDRIHTIDFPKEVFGDKTKRLFQTVKKDITSMKIDSSSGVELTEDLAKLMRDNPNEALKLPVDIDYEDKSKQQGWYIEIDGKHTKSKKNRNVGIPEHLVKRIREYLWEREYKNTYDKYKDAVCPDENLNIVRSKHTTAMGVFDEVEIIPFKSVKTSFQTLCDIAGLKHVSIHTLRHDFCTQNIKRGTDIYTVKKFAGHADIRTTMRYVHALGKKDFDALEALHDEHSI